MQRHLHVGIRTVRVAHPYTAVQGSVGWHIQRETKSSNRAFLVSGSFHSTATAPHGADRSSLEVVSTQSAHQSSMADQTCGR